VSRRRLVAGERSRLLAHAWLRCTPGRRPVTTSCRATVNDSEVTIRPTDAVAAIAHAALASYGLVPSLLLRLIRIARPACINGSAELVASKSKSPNSCKIVDAPWANRPLSCALGLWDAGMAAGEG
jgi:hypothetical protein